MKLEYYTFFSFLFVLVSICWSAITHKTPKTGSAVFKGIYSKSSRRQHYSDYQHPMNPMSDEMYETSINSNESVPDEQMLIARLLWNYDPAARPVYNASKPVVVNFGFLLVQICDMDERNQILTTNVWLEQEWFDERLQWNQSEFNNLDKIRIPCNRIWLPDIVLYNSADDFTESFMQSKAMVKPSGEVFWPPPAKLRSSCKIDVTFFPFDDQVCHIKFGSWTYSGLQLDLLNKSHTSDLTNYIKSGEWELISVRVERNIQYYPCCPDEPYPDVVFYIHIRRRILYYLFNIILPCVWLSILSLIGFWLPPDTGEKITLGITVLLAFSVFMLLIAENIPATSEMVPLIGIYLTVTMSLTSLSIILTVFVLQLHYAGQYSPRMSKSVYNFMTKKVANFICMSSTVYRFEENMKRNLEKFKSSNPHEKSTRSKLVNCENEVNKLKTTLKRGENGMDSFCCCCCPVKPPKKALQQNGIDKNHSTKHERPRKTYLAYPDEFDELSFLEPSDAASRREKEIYLGFEGVRVKKSNHHHHHHCIEKLNQWSNSNTVKVSPSSFSPSPSQRNNHSHRSNHVNHNNRELVDSLEIFSKNLRDYLVKQEAEAIKSNYQSEWKLVALVVDRILFWVFTILTIISTIVLLVAIPVWKNEYLSRGVESDQ